MGMNTKGFIDTDIKDVLVIGTLVERALIRLIAVRRREVFPGLLPWSSEVLEKFASPSLRLAPSTGLLSIDFTFEGERRCLTVFFDCDADRRQHCASSISMSMGCGGQAEPCMRAALHSLSVLGPAYINVNDVDGSDYAPVNPGRPRPTLLRLLIERLVLPYDFEKIVKKVEAGRLALDFEAFVGCDRGALSAVRKAIEDNNVRWDEIEKLAKLAESAATAKQEP